MYLTPYGLKIHKKVNGSGINLLRTKTFAQPKALKHGDILITGEKVTKVEGGYNGLVLVTLEEFHNGKTWEVTLDLPARIALALKPHRQRY